MLSIRGVSKSFGALQALKEVSFDIDKNRVHGIIGPNGAGKTILLETTLGINTPHPGEITFKNRPISGVPADRNVRAGLCLVPEGRGVFASMSVLDNLLLGAHHNMKNVARNLKRVYQWFPRLEERKYQIARTLSGGERQMLAIARSLMSAPELIMVDEPSLGLAPIIVNDIFDILLHLNREEVDINTTMVLSLGMGMIITDILSHGFNKGLPIAFPSKLVGETPILRVGLISLMGGQVASLAVSIIAGLGNLAGGLVVGLALGILEALVQGYISGSWSNAIAFVVMLFRPRGLFGINEAGGIAGKPVRVIGVDTALEPQKGVVEMGKIVEWALVALGPVPEPVIPQDAVTFGPLVVKALDMNPDGIIIACWPDKAAKIVQELKSRGWTDMEKILLFSSADDAALYTTHHL